MPSLPSIPPVSREVLAAIGAVAVLLALWLWARYGRRRFVVINKSGAAEAIAYELGRIANALERLERLATPREAQASAEEKLPRRENWLSLFRR